MKKWDKMEKNLLSNFEYIVSNDDGHCFPIYDLRNTLFILELLKEVQRNCTKKVQSKGLIGEVRG